MSAPVVPFPFRAVKEYAEQACEAELVDLAREQWAEREKQRADRSELLAALVGAVVILAEVKDPIGRAYREGLVGRIRSMIEREHLALSL